MAQLKDRGHPDAPPPMATDGKGEYREAMVETCGRVPDYSGVGRPPTVKRPQPEWQYLQVVKTRSGSRLIGVTIKVIYGDPESVPDVVGAHTAYVERSNLTSRQMNGRLVRKTLSYSKQLDALRASCAWEDWVVGLHPSTQDTRDPAANGAAAMASANTRDGSRIDRSPMDC
jgi:hypothetical protein